MSEKTQFKVRCPRCRKDGMLRLKQRGGNTVIVYHYDKKTYQRGTKGTKSCYIGSLNSRTNKIYQKYYADEQRYEIFDYFEKAWSKLKTEIRTKGRIKEIQTDSEGLEKFAEILNELRKIRLNEEKFGKVKGQRLEWSIRCPKCRTGIDLHATFQGVDRRKPINLWNTPGTRIHYRAVDATKDVIANPFFGIFLQFPVFSSL